MTQPGMSSSQTAVGPAPHHYQFHSELAQFCFPAATRESYAKYAYANSIFAAFLAIGILGIVKPREFRDKALPELQEFMPVDLPPPVDTPPPPETEVVTEEPLDEAPAEPFQPLVVAAANAPVAFAMPVDTTNVVIAKIADLAPPPPRYVPPDRPATPLAAPRVERFRLGAASGPRGIFPRPPFYSGVLRSGQSASVLIYIEVAPDGGKTKVEVRRSSGVPDLDRRVLQHVTTRWRFDAPGVEKRYEWEFVMEAN